MSFYHRGGGSSSTKPSRDSSQNFHISTPGGASIPPPKDFSSAVCRAKAPQVPAATAAAPGYLSMSGAKFLAPSGMDAVSATMQYGMNARKKSSKFGGGSDDEDESYFDEEEDEKKEKEKQSSHHRTFPSKSSSKSSSSTSKKAPPAAQDEDDPLDAFMAEIETQAAKDKATSERHEKDRISGKEKAADESDETNKQQLGRTDIEGEEDMQESYFRWLEEHPEKVLEEEEFEYDEEGNVIIKKRFIDPLPPIDHSQIEYEPFERNFYVEHEDISSLNFYETAELRRKFGISVSGPDPPKPVSSFAHFGFDEKLMDAIRKSEYSQPTPIQAQGIPCALSGRDMIGIAKTGSGKTVTYLWPALVHIMDQRELEAGEGPIVLICVPTRELAIQVYNEARKFGRVYNIQTVCAYGGGQKYEQSKALAEGAEMIVCTPGRLIDHVKSGATNLKRVTYLVFDEADRMFDMGFEPQVRSIADHVRPDRQCLMFSATFKKKVEKLARDLLTDPVRVVQGELGEANENIQQTVEIVAPEEKFDWLLQRLVTLLVFGKVLIFATKKQDADILTSQLKAKDFDALLLHGDMLQHERNEVIQKFRSVDAKKILVATDVAARGLDIPAIKTVVNYDIARDIDTHVHRVGRTGRAGEKGYAYTLVSPKDKEFAGHLVRNLESVNQEVPQPLLDLAMQSEWFRNRRFKQTEAKRIGGAGLGFKQRLGLGASTAPPSSGSSNKGPGTIKDALNLVKSASGGTDRVSALKQAFSAQYRMTFQAARESGASELEFSDPKPEWKRKADELKQQQQKPDEDGGGKKRKTRWN